MEISELDSYIIPIHRIVEIKEALIVALVVEEEELGLGQVVEGEVELLLSISIHHGFGTYFQ